MTKAEFAATIASGAMPQGYALCKLMDDIWQIEYLGTTINRCLDRPFQLYSEQEARETCWIHYLARTRPKRKKGMVRT